MLGTGPVYASGVRFASQSDRALAIAKKDFSKKNQKPQDIGKIHVPGKGYRAVKYLRSVFPGLLLILDIIHVVEYLWKAAYALTEPQSDEARLWVRARLLRILKGEVSQVVRGMRQSATKRELSPENREAIDTACVYFLGNKDRMCYDEYLARGLPIASGAAEGACGHLVKDRMEITGAIWDVQDDRAEAILRIRALDKSGDWDEYWSFHMAQERKRLYTKPWNAVS